MSEKQNKNYNLSEDNFSEEVRVVLNALLERDNKDAKIDETNRNALVRQGLALNSPARVMVVDTGVVIGAENVAMSIKDQMEGGEKILSIEGASGTGKGAMAGELKKILDGHTFSMGEVFRYLTHLFLTRKSAEDIFFVFNEMSYRPSDNGLKLFHGEFNVSDGLLLQLREKKLEEKIPEVASFIQKHVIEFSCNEILKLRDVFGRPIIIEGRAFTLDFLPCDLRIKLDADPLIRAQRRLNQSF